MTAYRDRRESGMYAPSGQSQKAEAQGLDALTKDELLKLAQEKGISPANAAMTKAELIAALEAQS